jgi:hypothetical protein
MQLLIDGYTVLLDEEDAHLLVDRTWRVMKNPNSKLYVRWTTTENGKGRIFYLHRLVMDAPKGVLVDHWDGNTLDCRKANLRLASHAKNSHNMAKWSKDSTSKFKGISWKSKRKRWVSQISCDGKYHYLGLYSSEIHAAYVYDLASIQHHGEYGRTNFLPLVR